MEKNWFIYSNQVVSGPFSTEQVKKDLSMGRWTPNDQIWWRGQKEWLSLDRWYTELDQILQSNAETSQQPVWYAEQEGFQFGPVTKTTLIGYLRNLPHLKNVRLWTVGLNHWTNLFEFHDILDQMNITKREFDRAPIVGEVEILKDGKKFLKSLASVSGGGLGVKQAEDLTVGEMVMVAIRSHSW